MKADGPQLYLKCEHCGCMFEHNGGKRRRWCSDAHKQAAWREQRQAEHDKFIADSHVCQPMDTLRSWPAAGPCPHCGKSPL